MLDATLRLAAHEDDEICPFARLWAQCLVGNDERRSRRYKLGDAISGLLGNDYSIKGRFRHGEAGRGLLGIAAAALSSTAICFVCTAIGMAPKKRNHAPPQSRTGTLYRREDVRAYRPIGILDGDCNLQDGLKRL